MASESYATLTWLLFRFSSSPNVLKANLWMSVHFSPGYNMVSPCISVDCASANSTNSVLELFRKILQLYWAHTLFCHSPWEIEYDNSLCGAQLSPCHYCVGRILAHELGNTALIAWTYKHGSSWFQMQTNDPIIFSSGVLLGVSTC